MMTGSSYGGTETQVKAVRKALESLFQKPNQSVRDFALEVEDVLAEFITVSSVGIALLNAPLWPLTGKLKR